MAKPLNITAYSTALYSTWIFVEDFGLVFDAGDGLAAGLLGKSGKVKQVFISHADRDHITGLLQFNQLNSRPGFPKYYYPKDSGSFPAMRDFMAKFDPHVSGAEWHGLVDGDQIELNKRLQVKALRNEHIPAPAMVAKSLSYQVVEQKEKLKSKYQGTAGRDMAALIAAKGREEIFDQTERVLLSYSGDTPVGDFSRWSGSEILIHEATFLESEGDTGSRLYQHSTLEGVLNAIKEIEIGCLVLTHFSTRYDHATIKQNIREMCTELRITFPVYAVLPGQIHRNILVGEPVSG